MLQRIVFALALASALGAQTPITTAAQAAQAETSVESNPDDLAARARLLTYYSRTGVTTADRVRPLRRKHILYLIEHHPAASVLGEAPVTIDTSGHALADPEGYRLAEAAWKQHFTAAAPPANVYTNAIQFFKTADPVYARRLAAEGLARYPEDVGIAAQEGVLDALAILGAKMIDNFGNVSAFDDAGPSSDAAVAARRELETTANPHIAAAAGGILQRQQFSMMTHRREWQLAGTFALAEHCYERAIQLDPKNPAWSAGLRLVYSSEAAGARTPEDRVRFFGKAAAMPGPERDRWYPMTDLADAQFAAGAVEKAAASARDVLEIATRYRTDWNYGNAIHKGNIVLGKIALQRGDAEAAAKLLAAAGNTPGSPQLNSFGPDWTLAQALVAKGQGAAVLEYIALCRKFWKNDRGRLDDWSKAIESGSAPDFTAPPGVRTPQLIGQPAPPFTLTDLMGRKVSLADYKGKAVLLDFWATWCPPCRAEMPDFEKLHRELEGKDAAILTIDVDEPAEVAADYMVKEKFTYPVLLAKGTDTVAKYGVSAYPTLIAIDPAGRIASFTIGRRDMSALREALTLARGGAPAPTNALLAAPRQLSPAPGAVFDHYPRQTTLAWMPVDGAAAYMVETEYFGNAWEGHAAFRVTDPVYSFRFVGAQPGRWRVYAVDAAGREGAKSGWREFRYTQ